MILRSIRTFDEISIRIWNFLDFSVIRLVDILNKNQNNIRKVSFAFTVIDEKLLIRLLSLLPKLEVIVLDVSLSNSSNDNQRKLSCLTQVRSVTCKVESAKIIFELADDILTSLSFCSSLHDSPPSTKLLSEIFLRQSRIEDLNVDPLNVDIKSLRKLKLGKLRIVNGHHGWRILQEQRELLELKLLANSTTKTFMEICQLKCLKTLIVDVREIVTNYIRNLNGLNNLEEFSIHFDPTKQQFAVAELSFPKLSSLDLTFSPKFDLQFNESTLIGSPKLKTFKLARCNFNLFCKLLENKNLESLAVGSLTNCFEDIMKNNEVVHHKLKALYIEQANDISIKVLKAIVDSLPGVETIAIGNVVKDYEDLRIILTACKRLTHVTVSNLRNSINVDHELIKLVKGHGKNLMHFELGIVKLEANEGLRIYRKHFERQFEFFQLKDNKIILTN